VAYFICLSQVFKVMASELQYHQMNKTNIAVGVGTFVAVLAIGGGAMFFWRGHYSLKLARSAGPDYSAGQASLSADDSAAAGSAASSGGLSVGSTATGGSLGQLGTSSSSSGGSGGQTGGSSSGGAGSPSPDTFAQYEKYKTSQNALFGEEKVGTSTELTAGKQAAVYYKGWLTNGQMFDQSRPGSDGKLQPFNFTLGAHQVIPGWEEGVAGMKVGGTRLIIVPPTVGYGDKGQGPIPGGAVLVFEVQLLAVQ
jgi:FKBP-type peptidyl-prolyl cis-trans isomerase FkpA